VDETLARTLTPEVIAGILAVVPDSWLVATGSGEADATTNSSPAAAAGHLRDAYARYLHGRLEAPRSFVAEAGDAR
jgi:hypothetical protein